MSAPSATHLGSGRIFRLDTGESGNLLTYSSSSFTRMSLQGMHATYSQDQDGSLAFAHSRSRNVRHCLGYRQQIVRKCVNNGHG